MVHPVDVFEDFEAVVDPLPREVGDTRSEANGSPNQSDDEPD